jgi:long-chain acyl-CoA synthetase
MPRANLLSLFQQFPNIGRDTAVIQTQGYRRQQLTYAQLYAHALNWSRALASAGIGPGDRVLLWGPNSAQWIACFWAILLREAVAVPMDSTANREFVERVIRDAQVKLILRDAAQPEAVQGPATLVYEGWRPAPQSSDGHFPAGAPGPRAERKDLAEILFTSGTTSDPRGVVLTNGNFLANLEPIEEGINEYRRYARWFHPLHFVSAVPLTHVFGQVMGIFIPPMLGATTVFENSALPTEMLRSVRQERTTILIAVPRMLDGVRIAIEQEIDSRGWRAWFNAAYSAAAKESFNRRVWRFRRLHSWLGWKFWAFICGGAALSSQTEEFFNRIGYAVVQGYGMTETASLISLNHPLRIAEGSVGKILPGREFRLAEDGEILVRGENVSAGYWEKGALWPAGGADGGWLRTGDLGELDAEGNLRFRGRKKNMIVTPAGLNVYPEDLEAAVRRQPGIRDVVVIPLEVGGNAEACAVLLTDPSVLASDAVRSAIDAANATLADYQRIRRWLAWPEPDFPRTTTGKPRLPVISSRAAELLGGTRNSQAESFTSSTSSSSLTALPSNLADLSSLDRVELMSSLEHRYHVELNETAFANAKSPADLERLLAHPSARRTDFVYPRWTQRTPMQMVRVIFYYALNWPITLILGHPRVYGRENLAGLNGPALFVSNHVTRKADINLILYALPARFRNHLATAMGGENLKNTFRHPPREWFLLKRWTWQVGYFLLVALFNVFPLPQFSGFRESFRFAGESVDRGYNLLVFPEGIINDRDTIGMAPFQAGIGLLAQNLRLPVVPMRIDGLWKMRNEKRRFAHRGELIVRIGQPISFPPGTPPADIASRLQSAVESL